MTTETMLRNMPRIIYAVCVEFDNGNGSVMSVYNHKYNAERRLVELNKCNGDESMKYTIVEIDNNFSRSARTKVR